MKNNKRVILTSVALVCVFILMFLLTACGPDDTFERDSIYCLDKATQYEVKIPLKNIQNRGEAS